MDESAKTANSWPPIRLPLDISSDTVHVVRVQLDISIERYFQLNAILSDDERARAARFRFDEPRHRFVACRASLRQLLGDCCSIAPNKVSFQYGQYGKPELALAESAPNTPRIEFNVSHSGDLGLIAIALGARVGIDIEECNPSVKALKLAERFFAPSEADELRNLVVEKHLAGFYRGWTCKEAYIKATGQGLSLPLSSFCVSIDPDQPATLKQIENQPDEPSRWTTMSLDVAPNYAAAVIAETPTCQIQHWDWPAR